MRRLSLLAAICACGGGGDPDVLPDVPPDTPPTVCQPQPAIGQFIRRQGNPRVIAGQTFPSGLEDTTISDPDVRFDGGRYELFYGAVHATTAGAPGTTIIRRSTSPDRLTWTADDEPALAASASGWDTEIAAPTVVVNPDAPAERRYLMLYAGASRPFPHPGYDVPEHAIGAAFSADGVTFTRIDAEQSPHGEAGLVLTGAQVYPTAVGAIVGDPELAYVGGIYHLWFSSLACQGPSCATVTHRGIGHATSADGITWTVDAAPIRSLLRASADNTTGGTKPSVIYDAVHCKWELWMVNDLPADASAQPVALDNMAGAWRAESADGAIWSVFFTGPRDLAWNQATPSAGERLGLAAGVDVAQNASGRLMLYVGYDDQDVPSGYTLPSRAGGTRPGVMTLDVATRDLP
jgi:hypothetical protein